MTKSFLTTSLPAEALIDEVYYGFTKVSAPRTFNRISSPIIDQLMSGLPIFNLKFLSLLAYDQKRKDCPIEQNLKKLFHIANPPSDTYLKERLD